MSDRMRPIPFGKLMDWILAEHAQQGSVFGIRGIYTAAPGTAPELPFGPAAGPHTQLAQNIIAAYIAGARFFELKTVQTLDGEDLPVEKPCIRAEDECYNVEWSTELRVPEAMEEYIKAWYALKLLSRELSLGSSDGFQFNMSVGYDLEGIRSPKIDAFIEGLKCARDTAIFAECRDWALSKLSRFRNIDADYVEGISPRVCDSITLSTLHGCPPEEIERIASYLVREKKLNTYVKCNPTLLGYDFARETMDALGFDMLAFDDHHFREDLQLADALPMLRRLQALAEENGLSFGVKLTNTFPVGIVNGELPGNEMYMSGRALFPLSISVARLLAEAFEGRLRISFSGGADAFNLVDILKTGIAPVTLATTLLKPGGYGRLTQLAELIQSVVPPATVDVAAVRRLAEAALHNPLYEKPIKPAPPRKMPASVPLLDCFEAPCRSGCPIGQDIPAYLRLAGEGKHLEALRVITERNPLPFITGTICPHPCAGVCTRGFYESPIDIRRVKLECAQAAYDELCGERSASVALGARVAIVGGGPAGLAAADFLAREGFRVTLFDARKQLGGIVRHVIPEFRIADSAIDKDIERICALGVEVVAGRAIESVAELFAEGFEEVILAVGAWSPGRIRLEGGQAMNVLDFLERFKSDAASLHLGENVVIIGGGNTAMDAARAAKRAPGVQRVTLAYRRTKRYMPADEEELQLALQDGVEFQELVAPERFENGALVCRTVKLGEPDASGRRSPVLTEERVSLPADTVIAAVGEGIDRAFFEANGIELDARGFVVADAQTMETSAAHVYVIGDARRGPATVVEAIADAQACAKAIGGKDFARFVGLNVREDEAPARSKRGRLCAGGCAESERCLECPTVCECCVEVCPNRANVMLRVDGRPQIVHLDALCNECGNCETFCPYSSAPYKDKFTYFANASDFADSANDGFYVAQDGAVYARLDGDAVDVDALPAGLRRLVAAMRDGYAYMMA